MSVQEADAVFSENTGIELSDIEDCRALIGQPLRILQHNREATIDTIRNYAHGIGDDNPLWCDEDYAAKSVHGTVVGPPSFYYSIFSAGVTPGFDGLQGFFGTGRWEVNRLPRRGERIIPEARLLDVFEKAGSNSKRMVVQEGEATYHTPDGELLARYWTQALRVPRPSRGGGLNYAPRAQHVYTSEEFADIERQIIGYQRRGGTPLYWDDVTVGDKVPVLVKGPLTHQAIIAYYAGNLPLGYFSTNIHWKIRHAAHHAPETIPNNRSLGWLREMNWPGLGHMDSTTAAAAGMPGVYDNGWNRVGWSGQLLTDWIGDHGHVRMYEVRLRRPNLVGDTLWLTGTVTEKAEHGPHGLVKVEIEAKNQLGDTSLTGKGEVLLPLRPGAAPVHQRATA